MARQRFSNEQLKARLIVFIGVILALVFLGSVFGILWALIFVTQPLGEQAPNDRAFIELDYADCVPYRQPRSSTCKQRTQG